MDGSNERPPSAVPRHNYSHAGCLKEKLMSLRKVYGGTPVGNESRCDTCSHARIIQGYAESERITFCDAMYDPIRIPFKVSQCSDYEDKRLPTLKAMEDVAWFLRIKSAGSVAGFVSAKEMQALRERGEEPETAIADKIADSE
jgi:hypothetical protein